MVCPVRTGDAIAGFMRLEEINPMLRVERDDCFLPIFGGSLTESRPASLALAVLRRDLQDLYVKQRLDRTSHIFLCRQAIDFECVRVVARRLVHSLFGHERLDDHLMRFQRDRRRLRYMAWHN
jgi:hypothetical protein